MKAKVIITNGIEKRQIKLLISLFDSENTYCFDAKKSKKQIGESLSRIPAETKQLIAYNIPANYDLSHFFDVEDLRPESFKYRFEDKNGKEVLVDKLILIADHVHMTVIRNASTNARFDFIYIGVNNLCQIND